MTYNFYLTCYQVLYTYIKLSKAQRFTAVQILLFNIYGEIIGSFFIFCRILQNLCSLIWLRYLNFNSFYPVFIQIVTIRCLCFHKPVGLLCRMKTQDNFSIFQRGSMSNRSISNALHRIYIECSSGKCFPCIFVYFENFYIHLIGLIVVGHRWYDIIFHCIADIYSLHFCGQFVSSRSFRLFHIINTLIDIIVCKFSRWSVSIRWCWSQFNYSFSACCIWI